MRRPDLNSALGRKTVWSDDHAANLGACTAAVNDPNLVVGNNVSRYLLAFPRSFTSPSSRRELVWALGDQMRRWLPRLAIVATNLKLVARRPFEVSHIDQILRTARGPFGSDKISSTEQAHRNAVPIYQLSALVGCGVFQPIDTLENIDSHGAIPHPKDFVWPRVLKVAQDLGWRAENG